ncbi:hypothetical protein Q1695_009255 [Nippostrongylus brasiliensis]|nr:hypothetical protein Q1695_009255 [Nippostrongylus brasiliensis]
MPSGAGSLSPYISSGKANCDIDLLVGDEYLLAGAVQPNGFLHTFRCGQIVGDDWWTPRTAELGLPLEWTDVSTEMISNLRGITCRKHRNNRDDK